MLNDTATPTTAAPAPAPAPQPRPHAATPFPARLPRVPVNPCDVCGEPQGFLVPDHHHFYECVRCATRRIQTDLAREQLLEAVSPILGMWVAYWRRVGLPLEELDEVVQLCTGAWMAQDHEERFRLKHLRRLGLVYREAAAAPAPDPVRVVVDPATLPLIARQIEKVDALGRATFFDAKSEQISVFPGPDAVILPLEGGIRAVVYLGSQITPGFRCPAHLWPAVAAELKYLPEGAVRSASPASHVPEAGGSVSAA